ncbi:polysaccharide pyruvyl transferase family protein [Nitrosomonas sp.]|uniref:polysaccharide pyruvyl transferase family protein n=1 Tax=Nitrosomonas sp. TaxID=42353 RepID=UPI0025DED308|nr:polysaccharide pyruvyl transferase family protein [Nitrosomonas sp.]
MRVYLTGQRTFGNRGCEAIVRSTVAVLKNTFENVQVLVPSDDIERDAKQWPEAVENGVQFVQAYIPAYTRYWVHMQRLPLPFLKRAGWPFPFPSWFTEQLRSVDMVMAIGGDNYSLDYRLPSLWQGIDGLAVKLGKPVILWGASVGPFENEPFFVPVIRQHLLRFSQVIVRESVSYAYLTEVLGLNNASQMADPAFALTVQPVDHTEFWPKNTSGVVGLNISPLIERYKKPDQNLIAETVHFIQQTIIEKGYGVLLIPHVIPLNRVEKNNDAVYMANILRQCGDLGERIKMAPAILNAAQLKYVIGQLRFFVGARTHATIAALSSGVPTVSIAYSIKARGINRDLFGDESMVVPTSELSSERLVAALDYLVDNEEKLRNKLALVLPDYQNKICQAMQGIKAEIA